MGMILHACFLPDLAVTEEIARRLAPCLRKGDCVALQGPLGAGKTTFARALLGALGIQEDVPSPTFTLVQMYQTPALTVSHFDLYRLKDESELDELGWDEALADGLVVAEWPERAGRRLPKNRLVLHFAFDTQNLRTLGFEALGESAKFSNAVKGI